MLQIQPSCTTAGPTQTTDIASNVVPITLGPVLLIATACARQTQIATDRVPQDCDLCCDRQIGLIGTIAIGVAIDHQTTTHQISSCSPFYNITSKKKKELLVVCSTSLDWAEALPNFWFCILCIKKQLTKYPIAFYNITGNNELQKLNILRAHYCPEETCLPRQLQIWQHVPPSV